MNTDVNFKVVNVTPELAARLLDSNTKNRSQVRNVISKYADMMKKGDWLNNAEPIKFSGTFEEPNRCLDGQHRLMAVIEAGISVEMSLAFNVPEGSAHTIDAGRKRSHGDHIYFAIEGLQSVQARDLGSVVPMLIKYENLNKWVASGANVIRLITESLVLEYTKEHLVELLDGWKWVKDNLTGSNILLRSLTEIIFYRVVTKRIDEHRSDDFMKKVFGGECVISDTVEMTLRNWLLAMKSGQLKTADNNIIQYSVARAFNRATYFTGKNYAKGTLIYKFSEDRDMLEKFGEKVR